MRSHAGSIAKGECMVSDGSRVRDNCRHTALVLEGGGLRGVYTSGVLQFLMERQLFFGYVIGVSMGACNAANYVSNQPQRNRIVNIHFVNDRRYLSYLRLFLKGELFGMDFIFDTIPNQLVPFDYKTFRSSPQRCLVTVTDCMSGEALYYEKAHLGADYLKVLQASCSLPLVARPVQFGGRTLMDGGLSDPIPLAQSIRDGNRKHVLILTRPKGYRKENSWLVNLLVRLRYPRFKGLQRALVGRAASYNKTLEWIETLVDAGQILVLRPRAPLGAGRVERNKENLYSVYDQGYADAEKAYVRLCDYLSRPSPMTLIN